MVAAECVMVIGPQRYRLPSSQCLDTGMIYEIYLLLKLTVPK